MKILIIIIISAAILYIAVNYIIAVLYSKLIYMPKGSARPTYEQVKQNMKKEFEGQNAQDAVADFDGFEKWEQEEIDLENHGYIIKTHLYQTANAKASVILCHGFGQNRYVMVPFAEIFRAMGYNIILFDERAFGESQAEHGGFSELECTDIAVIAEWLKKHYGEDKKVVALGVSMGAMSVMKALAYTDKIDYAIEDCGPARMIPCLKYLVGNAFHMYNPFIEGQIIKIGHSLGLMPEKCNPIESVAETDKPILIVHGDKDRAVPLSDAREIFSVCKNSKSRIEIFEGRDHAYSICDRSKYEIVLRDFLSEV